MGNNGHTPWAIRNKQPLITTQQVDYDTNLALARFRTPHQCQTSDFRLLLEKSIPIHSTKSTNS